MRKDWGPAVYTHENARDFHDCTGSLCYNGGVNIGRLVRSMVREKKTVDEIPYVSCQGFRGSPKGKKNHGPCDHSFKVKVTITYKPESQ